MRQRHIFMFWLPLFGSWLLMAMEGPVITTVVSRLPEPVIMLAAVGIVLGLSVLIQSPIMNLLATSTAKVRDYETYLLVRRFTLHWIVFLTAVTALMAYTPLFDLLIIRGMGVSSDIAEWVRVGLRINVLWSAAVAWRRFLQGVLIRFNRPQTVVVGTVIRLITGALTAVSLMLFTDVPGIVVGSCTLQIAVIAEAIYATLVVRPLFRHELVPQADSTVSLTYRDLFFFHLPLAGTAVLALLVQPLAIFSLARLANPTTSLAAWPVLFQILFLSRAPAMAMPEVIIALNKNQETTAALFRFVGLVAAATLVGMFLFMVTPLENFYLDVIQEVPASVGELVREGVWLTLLFPFFGVVVFSLRGFLISQQLPHPVNSGMAINLAITALWLFLGLIFNWSGITTAALALTLAVFIETIYLVIQVRPIAKTQLELEQAPLT